MSFHKGVKNNGLKFVALISKYVHGNVSKAWFEKYERYRNNKINHTKNYVFLYVSAYQKLIHE